MNKAHIVIHTHESSPGWLLKLTQANHLQPCPRCLLCNRRRAMHRESFKHMHRVFINKALSCAASRPHAPPPRQTREGVVSPKYCVGCSLHNATRAPRLARKLSLVLRLLKLPVWAPRRPCITEVPSTATPSSSVAPECILKLASAAKMTWAPGACSCASGATIRLLRVARKWSLVLRL